MGTDVRTIIAAAVAGFGTTADRADDVLAALAAHGFEVIPLPPVTITGDDPDDWTVLLRDGSYYVGMNKEPEQLREQAAAFLAVARHMEAQENEGGRPVNDR